MAAAVAAKTIIIPSSANECGPLLFLRATSTRASALFRVHSAPKSHSRPECDVREMCVRKRTRASHTRAVARRFSCPKMIISFLAGFDVTLGTRTHVGAAAVAAVDEHA